MLKEFKEFALRGNVLDMAVGVIIGTAFGRIVSSLVNDIIMPPIGVILGEVDFSNLFINLSKTGYKTVAEAKVAGVPTINYGLFLNTVVDFIIVSFAIFIFIKQINKLKRRQPAMAQGTKECPYCLSDVPIRATRCPDCTSVLEVPAEKENKQ